MSDRTVVSTDFENLHLVIELDFWLTGTRLHTPPLREAAMRLHTPDTPIYPCNSSLKPCSNIFNKLSTSLPTSAKHSGGASCGS